MYACISPAQVDMEPCMKVETLDSVTLTRLPLSDWSFAALNRMCITMLWTMPHDVKWVSA